MHFIFNEHCNFLFFHEAALGAFFIGVKILVCQINLMTVNIFFTKRSPKPTHQEHSPCTDPPRPRRLLSLVNCYFISGVSWNRKLLNVLKVSTN